MYYLQKTDPGTGQWKRTSGAGFENAIDVLELRDEERADYFTDGSSREVRVVDDNANVIEYGSRTVTA